MADETNSRVTLAERLTRIEMQQKQQGDLLEKIDKAVESIPVLVVTLQEARKDLSDHEDRLRAVERRTSGTWEIARIIGSLLAGLLGGWGGAKGA